MLPFKMASRPVFYTLRKHWKKSIFAACLSLYGAYYGSGRFREYLVRREICKEAKMVGQQPIAALEKPRRMYVLLNPAANKGTALKLYEKNVAPILHLAAIDVTLIKTDYEGHAKAILGYIDPSIDGIIVAGGDGTLLEVVTGFIRLQDKDVVSQIPIGVIPLGRTNKFFYNKFSTASQNARTLGNAAMAIVRGKTKHVDVMEVSSDGVRPTYCLSGLNWGLFQEVKTKIDAKKHWWAGPWKRHMAFVTRTLRNWPSFYSGLLYLDGHSVGEVPQPHIESESDSVNSLKRDKSNSLLTPKVENLKDHESTQSAIKAGTINLEVANIDEHSEIHVQLLDSDISRTDFIAKGVKWMENNFSIVQSDGCKEFFAEHVRLSPKMDYVTFFHIDGEEFEAKDVSIEVHKDKLLFFDNCQ